MIGSPWAVSGVPSGTRCLPCWFAACGQPTERETIDAFDLADQFADPSIRHPYMYGILVVEFLDVVLLGRRIQLLQVVQGVQR